MNKKRGSLSLHPSRCRPHPLIRVFCAVELPAEVQERAADHIADLRSRMPQARAGWAHSGRLHITMKFLGEIEQQDVAALSGAAARAARSLSPFHLIIEGAGVFPPRGLPRVLWLGVTDASASLNRLQLNLESECADAGFAREARPFHPHLTIARLRDRTEGARRLAALHQEKGFAPIAVSVSELILMRSQLGPGGSIYTELSRHRLGVL
jgi:RNA 2',3'-cyclic 3'-phosphodiesterase